MDKDIGTGIGSPMVDLFLDMPGYGVLQRSAIPPNIMLDNARVLAGLSMPDSPYHLLKGMDIEEQLFMISTMHNLAVFMSMVDHLSFGTTAYTIMLSVYQVDKNSDKKGLMDKLQEFMNMDLSNKSLSFYQVVLERLKITDHIIDQDREDTKRLMAPINKAIEWYPKNEVYEVALDIYMKKAQELIEKSDQEIDDISLWYFFGRYARCMTDMIFTLEYRVLTYVVFRRYIKDLIVAFKEPHSECFFATKKSARFIID